MMNLSFQQKHIQDWAVMADDFNPIHFDDAAAKRLGLDGIVVHGMLPLLHIKHQLSAEMFDEAPGEWITFNSKFRQPVAKDQQHALEITSRRSGRRFALRRHEDGAEAIAGTATPARGIEIVSPPMVTFGIDTDIVCEKLARFRRAFPKFDAAWLFLDSLVFSQFLSNDVPYSLVKSAGAFSSAANQQELMQRALTVQTSHTVSVHPDLLRLSLADLDSVKPIRCDLMPAVTTNSGTDTLAGACQFNVYVDNRFVLQSEVGIFLRFTPR